MDKKPIRVLHILTALDRGGIETMLMNYYRNIDTDSLQFDFLLHRKGKFAYSDEVIKRGGKIFYVEPFNPWSKKYLNSLDNFFSEHREYKIVHSHLNCLSAVPLKYAKNYNIPVRIAHSHIIIHGINPKNIVKLILKNLIPKYANYLFACSDEAGKWMFHNHNFFIIRNAINVDQFIFDERIRNKMRKELGLENKYIIGHVGRFTNQKNQEFLLKLLKKMKKGNSEIALVLVGEGENKKKLLKKIELYGIKDKVIVSPPRNDIADLMQAFDVFAFPSLFEGLGIVAIESQAAGLKTICSNRVPKEVKVTDLVEFLPLDINIWEDAIVKCFDYHNREQTYNKIRLAHYDIKNEAIYLQKIYLQLISDKS